MEHAPAPPPRHPFLRALRATVDFLSGFGLATVLLLVLGLVCHP